MAHDPNPYVIFTYTRKQAIEDGVLIDITEYATKYGSVIIGAITANLFNQGKWPSIAREIVAQPSFFAIPFCKH